MCLLHLLWKSGADITAAHFEHGIRGEESLRDANFVRGFCLENNIDFVTESADVPGYAEAHSMGIEEAARKLRYEFLFRAAQERGCGFIATAHNADDNTETMLFNLTRGTGIAGLRGIPAVRGSIIRPLLQVSRSEIEEYLAQNNVPFIEDSSNLSDDYSRNLIRHRVTPVLKSINPGLNQAAARAARLLRQDDECLCAMADEFLEREFDGQSIDCKALCALHPAVSSRVLRRLLGGAMGMEHIEAVLSFAVGRGLGSLNLPGRTVRREQGRLYFTAQSRLEILPRRIVPGSRLAVPELGIDILAEYAEYGGEIHDLFKTYYIKCENIRGEVFCTGRRPGDEFRPISRNCTKKLKALFVEKGFTQARRDRTLIVRDDEGILLAVGLAAAQRSKPEPGDRVLALKIEKTNQEII